MVLCCAAVCSSETESKGGKSFGMPVVDEFVGGLGVVDGVEGVEEVELVFSVIAGMVAGELVWVCSVWVV